MSNRINRREFIRQAALTGAVVGMPSIWGCQTPPKRISPNEKLNIGVIGTAHRAAENINQIQGENIVALCDIDDLYLNAAMQKFPKAKPYNDFRKLLEQNDVEAVLIATPDHIHAPAAAMAMRLGKHVYCEKPLTHDVREARVLAELAAKHGLATQMGTQIHAENNYRRVVEIIQSGAIGTIGEVHVWVGKGWAGKEDRPQDSPAPPPNLHWELWLGPAPDRPYNKIYLPQEWRRWWDFGNGTLGDMGCHYIDLPFWALKLRHPTTVVAEGPPVSPETAPHNLKVRWTFPAEGKRAAVNLTWYDDTLKPPLLTEKGISAWDGGGVLFVGSKGMLTANYTEYKLWPEAAFKGFQPPPQTIAPSIGHHNEWVMACKTGSSTTCNFDYSGALTECVLLGNVAYRTGKKLEWNAKKLKATNCPEADQYIEREYRKGWKL